jgi:hypothetical protein
MARAVSCRAREPSCNPSQPSVPINPCDNVSLAEGVRCQIAPIGGAMLNLLQVLSYSVVRLPTGRRLAAPRQIGQFPAAKE